MMQRIVAGFILGFLGTIFSTTATVADEIRPGYLELKESGENIFTVLWKVPAKGDRKLSLQVHFPDSCKNKTPTSAQFINSAYIQRWLMVCEGGLIEKLFLFQDWT